MELCRLLDYFFPTRQDADGLVSNVTFTDQVSAGLQALPEIERSSEVLEV